MAQANVLIAELLSAICNEATYKHRRVTVYTVGGTQIGFCGLGQGDELLTVPGHYLVGEALKVNIGFVCQRVTNLLLIRAESAVPLTLQRNHISIFSKTAAGPTSVSALV